MTTPARSERLFRPRSRAGRLLTRAAVVATRERHIPGVTPRRVGIEAGLVLALVVTTWLTPPGDLTTSQVGAIRADAGTPLADGAGAAPVPLPAPAPPPVRAGRPPIPTMSGAPALPLARSYVGRAVLLTFDDGPDPRFTPQVLALLAAYDARAVFCVVGNEAEQNPDLIRAIVAAGHDLCNHTTSHDMDLATRPGPVIAADLAATQQALRRITGGLVPRYMRSPGGRWSPAVVAEARALRLEPLSWTVDSRDWTKPGLREIVDRVLRDLRPGGVVLLHDGGGDRNQTLLALPYLLRRMRQLGYELR